MQALAPGPEDRVLAIAGSGDIGFACSAAGSVDMVDVRQAQAAWVRLCLTAARELPIQSVRSLLGYGHHGRRVWFYHYLRPHLDEESRSFWDPNEGAIRMGLVEQGHVERRIAALRARFLNVAVDREAVNDVLASPDIAAQSGAFARRWDGWRWRAALRFALAPLSLMGSNLNTPRLVGADIGYPNRVAERVKHSFDTLDMRREPALRWALTGAHGGDDALEAAEANWLSTAGLTALKAGVPRMRIINARLAEVLDNPPPGGWTRFHIADALDELEPAAQTELLGRIVRGAAPNARMVSWRLVRAHARDPGLAGVIVRDAEASALASAREAVPAWSGVDVEWVHGTR